MHQIPLGDGEQYNNYYLTLARAGGGGGVGATPPEVFLSYTPNLLR